MVIDLAKFTEAFVMLFAMIYVLHLSHLKALANTFDFTQKVLMGLEDGKLKPRVLSLKNTILAVAQFQVYGQTKTSLLLHMILHLLHLHRSLLVF